MALGSMFNSTGAGSLGTLFVRLTADSSKLVKGMRKAEKQLDRSMDVMLGRLRTFSLAAAAMLALIGVAAVREFAKFDQAMTRSVAIMSDMTPRLRKEMELVARSLSTEFTFSATEAAEAYFFLASAGLSAEQSMASMPTVMNFATAGAFELSTATDLLTDAQSALGLTVKDTEQNMLNMTRVSDVLVKANTLSNATVQQFSESLTNKAGAALRQVNKDLEEGVAVLAAYADQGVKGAGAGEFLNIVMRDLQRTALGNKEGFAAMGIEVFNSAGDLNNMADIVGDLEDAMSGLSVEQKRATFELLGFQDRSLSALLALVGVSDKIRDYESALREAGGTTKDVADVQLTSFASQMKITLNIITNLLIVLGEALAPALRVINTLLQDSAKDSGSLTDAAVVLGKTMGVFLLGTVAVLADGFHRLKLVIGALQVAMAKVAQALGWILDKVFDLGEALGISNKAFKDMAKEAENARIILNGVADDAASDLKDLWEAGLPGDRMREQYNGIISDMKDANKEVAEDLKETVVDAVVDAQAELAAAEKQSLSRLNGLAMPHQPGFGEKGFDQDPLTSGLDFQSMADIQNLSSLQMEINASEEALEELQSIHDEELAMTEAVQQRKLEILQEYNERVRQLHIAQAQIVLSSSSRIFESLGSIAKDFAGEQSGIYKAMFAASKAFAIAESIVKIQQGIANAAGLPFPANLAAIASVVAATANIVSTIQSVKLQFSGERAVGGNVKAGNAYLVGERGPEPFIPASNGTIAPNSALGGGNVEVNVINNGDGHATVRERTSEDRRIIDIVVERTKNELGAEVMDGKGAFNSSIQTAYGLQRRGS
ncbi:MAG: putative minor tail protein [Prokaryotic dsDNA virus sp.]|nr:MAG: putative minor tail protein [Prokaryotic dsDNA virus sp.]|tara:strand:- start:39255 stop:41750 length:2496 start_codon:yes stop_codon:yes gene_type:complete